MFFDTAFSPAGPLLGAPAGPGNAIYTYYIYTYIVYIHILYTYIYYIYTYKCLCLGLQVKMARAEAESHAKFQGMQAGLGERDGELAAIMGEYEALPTPLNPTRTPTATLLGGRDPTAPGRATGQPILP